MDSDQVSKGCSMERFRVVWIRKNKQFKYWPPPYSGALDERVETLLPTARTMAQFVVELVEADHEILKVERVNEPIRE